MKDLKCIFLVLFCSDSTQTANKIRLLCGDPAIINLKLPVSFLLLIFSDK